MKISDVFFDLDHTLWDFEKNSALAIETIFKKHAIDVDLQLFLTHYVPINIKYWELYRVDEITQYELAKKSGLERKTINRIEQGHYSPSLKSLILLCSAMKVTPSDILDGI